MTIIAKPKLSRGLPQWTWTLLNAAVLVIIIVNGFAIHSRIVYTVCGVVAALSLLISNTWRRANASRSPSAVR